MIKINDWLKNVQYFLMPARCLLCDQKGLEQLDLCGSCSNAIKPIAQCCDICAEPFEQTNGGWCGHCLKKRPYFDKVFASTLYKDKAKTLVNDLKHHEKLAASKIIAQLLFKYWQQTATCHIDAVTYVPAHPLRKRERGYNQSYLIAKHFCNMANLPLANKLVKRIKWSSNQVGLTRKKRISNIKNAFEVQNNAPPKQILLIDDVVTTGSTVNEIARILKKAGAEKVFVLAFARTAK